MEIKVSSQGDVTVLELKGRLSLGGGAAVVREDVRRELDSGHHRLLLDILHVDAIDSTGLGVLVASLTTAHRLGGALKLLHPSPRVADVLEITQADRLFEIFDDEDLALQSFRQS
jgi:anti-anti-sigma factor